MRILVLTPDYPSPSQLYANAFVHQRVLGYLARGHEVEVFVYKWNRGGTYCHEGVTVRVGDQGPFGQHVTRFRPAVVAVHFFWFKFQRALESVLDRAPAVVWAHGIDFLAWHRRLFNLNQGPVFWKYACSNLIQRRAFATFARRQAGSSRVRYVLVSHWARRMAERDLGVPLVPHEIIPNPVNESLFRPRARPADLRLRVCFVRPFSSKKYAYDIAMESIRAFNRDHPCAPVTFTIWGDGREYEHYTRPLRRFSNVRLERGFLNQEQLAAIFADHGVFLCPTRQDAQGVSMCEAMMSGLVPITSRTSAIPEFCDETCGFLTDNTPREIGAALAALAHDPELFRRMSQAACDRMLRTCASARVIPEELRLLSEVAGIGSS